MKHFFLRFTILLMILPSLQSVGQEIFEIKIIKNAESIIIGKKVKRVGDSFNSKDGIIFPNDSASFIAIKKGTTVVKQFSKASMDAKKAKTVNEYFANDYAKVKGSSRGGYGNKAPISYCTRDTKKFPEKRIALVVGNSNYEKEDHLLNAVNDARDVSKKLKNLGFDVITLYDADIDDMQTTISSFFNLAKSYQVALIYFAGHGIRYAGKDYLLSTDRKDLSVTDECSLEDLVDESEKWKSANSVMIFVIDACRSSMGFNSKNEYKSIEARKGTFILQSTSSDEEALDGYGSTGNSPFATVFINGIGQSGIDIEDEFHYICKKVCNLTSNFQIPHASLGGGINFCFCKAATINEDNNTLLRTHPNKPQSSLQQQIKDNANDSDDYYLTGTKYYSQEDYLEATKWFMIGAGKDDTLSQYMVACCYLKRKMYKEAESWFRKAADQGYSIAQCSLGLLYEQGAGDIKQSYKEAVKWFEKAAMQGDANAQYYLGRRYYFGGGVPKRSVSEALKWYRKAASQGHPYAIEALEFQKKIKWGKPSQ